MFCYETDLNEIMITTNAIVSIQFLVNEYIRYKYCPMNFIHATKLFRHGLELKALEDIFLSFDKLKKGKGT